MFERLVDLLTGFREVKLPPIPEVGVTRESVRHSGESAVVKICLEDYGPWSLLVGGRVVMRWTALFEVGVDLTAKPLNPVAEARPDLEDTALYLSRRVFPHVLLLLE